MNKVVIFALLALFVCALAQDFKQSAFCKRYPDSRGCRDSEETDTEFFRRLGGLLKKAQNYGLIIDEEQAEKINWSKIFSPENIKKAVEIYKIIRSKDNVVESDAEAETEFFTRLGRLMKKVAQKKERKPREEKSEEPKKEETEVKPVKPVKKSSFLKKLLQKLKEKRQQKKQKKEKKPVEQPAEQPVETEADAEFFKKLGGLVKKVAPIVKKGFDVYKKAKGFGILSDEEEAATESAFMKELIKKLKEKLRQRKQKKQPKEEKPVEQPAETEADAEFFNKLKQWWNNKGKNIVEKGVNIYNKGKELGLIKDQTESDAEFFQKLKQWWENKGKDLANKGKDLIKAIKPEETEADFDKCAACKLACSFIKDTSKQELCVKGCDAFACKA